MDKAGVDTHHSEHGQPAIRKLNVQFVRLCRWVKDFPKEARSKIASVIITRLAVLKLINPVEPLQRKKIGLGSEGNPFDQVECCRCIHMLM